MLKAKTILPSVALLMIACAADTAWSQNVVYPPNTNRIVVRPHVFRQPTVRIRAKSDNRTLVQLNRQRIRGQIAEQFIPYLGEWGNRFIDDILPGLILAEPSPGAPDTGEGEEVPVATARALSSQSSADLDLLDSRARALSARARGLNLSGGGTIIDGGVIVNEPIIIGDSIPIEGQPIPVAEPAITSSNTPVAQPGTSKTIKKTTKNPTSTDHVSWQLQEDLKIDANNAITIPKGTIVGNNSRIGTRIFSSLSRIPKDVVLKPGDILTTGTIFLPNSSVPGNAKVRAQSK